MTKHDDKIKTLLATVEQQKAALGTKPRASWVTNAIFKYKDGTHLNLNTVRTSQPLVDALAYLLEKQGLQQAAANHLGVRLEPFSWEGYSLQEWMQDFKLRLDILHWEDKKAQLEATKKKLHALVSEEAKTEMELADIEKMLSQ